MRLLTLALLLPTLALSQTSAQPRPALATAPTQAAAVTAVRVETAPQLDGRLDDPVWSRATPVADFWQSEPVEGAPATHRTVVRIVYTDEALYVGAQLHDSAPDSIQAALGRRDAGVRGDHFTLWLDPYRDLRSGYLFRVGAGGTLLDGTIQNDTGWSDEWDGIWEAQTRTTDEGWTVEMRIPFSQLRFHAADEQVWGVDFTRFVPRNEEYDGYVYVPSTETGRASRFAELRGIRGVRRGRQIELTPYVTGGAAFTDQPTGNPFRDGSDFEGDVGLDFKLGLTNSLLLNATVNPDFGQVEVDPAVVNLSDNEVFLPEQRPFFVEGADVFGFGRGGSNSNFGFNWGNPDLLYTRRIGRAPQGGTYGADFDDTPAGVPILGAAKITGNALGSNVGVMAAATGRTHADVARFEDERLLHDRVEVEPLTFYSAARMQRELDRGAHGVGVMATSVVRQFGDRRLRGRLNSSAHVVGVDGWTRFGPDDLWALTFWGSASHIAGTAEQIARVQTDNVHRLQRPDRQTFGLDRSRTSLTGLAGRVMLNKQRGNWIFNTAVGAIDPFYDTNDLGFLWRSDVINAHAVGGYRWTQPGSWYRTGQVMVSHARSWTIDGGDPIARFVWSNAWVQLANYWSVNGFAVVSPQHVYSPDLTRGGPLVRIPAGDSDVGVGLSTDSRKPLRMGAEVFGGTGEFSRSAGGSVEAEWQPTGRVQVSAGPEISRRRASAQYVGTFADPTADETYGARYVFADLEQWQLSGNVRMSLTLTPQLSFQLFAQPLISSGAFSGFKQLDRGRAFAFTRFGEGGTTIAREGSRLTADPDGAGPAAPLSFSDPSFRFASLRGNAVLRWEYRPGSTLFLVWATETDDFEGQGTFRPRRSIDRLLDERPDHFLRVKLTYWFDV
jgi:hypothetical protein